MLDVYKKVVNPRQFMFNQPQMAQVIVNLQVVADGDAISMTVNGKTTVFEFNSVGGVTAGRVAVPIGGSSAITAQNLQLATQAIYGNVLRFVLDSFFLYIISNELATDFTGSTVAGGVTWTTLMPQRPIIPMAVAFINRVAQAIDVTLGKIVIYTGIDNIIFISPIFRVSTVNLTMVPWNGTISINGEAVTLFQGTGGGAWAANNLAQVVVAGDKSE